MKKLIAIILVLLGFGVVNLLAAGNYAGEMMSIGVGARPLGMGGTFAAIADDASTSYWNPAGLTNVKGVEVSSVKLTKLNDLETTYSYVNLVYNASDDIGAFGASWLRQSIGGITIAYADTSTLGYATLADNAEVTDNTFYLSYARILAKGFSMGTSIKMMMGSYPIADASHNLATTTNSGFGFDLGLYLDFGVLVPELKGFTFGLNAQDLYTAISWDTGATPDIVGMNFKPGIAYRLPIQQFEIVAGSDLDTRYGQMIVHGGGELWWNKMFAIRGGLKYWGGLDNIAGQSAIAQEADWSIGASIRWYFIGVDYAYVYNELTPIQYISIIGKF